MSDDVPTQAWQRTRGRLNISELPDMEVTANVSYALDEDEVAAVNAAALTKKEKAPYGDKVPYADDGVLGDGKKRFPIDCKHVKAALSYISQEKEKRRYTPAQYARIHAKIVSAYKRCFGETPPSER